MVFITVGARERLGDVVTGFVGGLAADLGVRAGAQAARQVGADVDLDVRVGDGQRLGIGVDGDELDAADALLDHAVDGVGSATANTDNLDDGKVVVDLVLVHVTVLRTSV